MELIATSFFVVVLYVLASSQYKRGHSSAKNTLGLAIIFTGFLLTALLTPKETQGAGVWIGFISLFVSLPIALLLPAPKPNAEEAGGQQVASPGLLNKKVSPVYIIILILLFILLARFIPKLLV